jgi:hypothetical protein
MRSGHACSPASRGELDSHQKIFKSPADPHRSPPARAGRDGGPLGNPGPRKPTPALTTNTPNPRSLPTNPRTPTPAHQPPHTNPRDGGPSGFFRALRKPSRAPHGRKIPAIGYGANRSTFGQKYPLQVNYFAPPLGRFASLPTGGSREIQRRPSGANTTLARERSRFPASRPDFTPKATQFGTSLAEESRVASPPGLATLRGWPTSQPPEPRDDPNLRPTP